MCVCVCVCARVCARVCVRVCVNDQHNLLKAILKVGAHWTFYCRIQIYEGEQPFFLFIYLPVVVGLRKGHRGLKNKVFFWQLWLFISLLSAAALGLNRSRVFEPPAKLG